MLDINLLRNNIEWVAARLAERGYLLDTTVFNKMESERKSLQTRMQELQARRNASSKQIGAAKGNSNDLSPIMVEVALLGEDLKVTEQSFEAVQQQLNTWLMSLPNLAHESVPVGRTQNENVELRRVGVPRQFDFKIRDHVDVGGPLGLDLEAGAKLAGTRFTVLKGEIALLHRAIAQFMLNTHTIDHGYVEYYTPYIVNGSALLGTGQLPKFSGDMFQVLKGGEAGTVDQYLISTSEITLTNIVNNRILNADELPLKLTAHSPCFRSEAGSYGQDTRGMIRQHQFDKVEMVRIEKPEESYAALEEMVSHAENILQALELPYRVILLCTGDLSFSASKTYDLEVWLPAQNTYREISSCSNCETFQARRMMARHKSENGKNQLVHTLNGSGLAVGRTLVAVLENYQNVDGSVTIPTVLRPYFYGRSKIGG